MKILRSSNSSLTTLPSPFCEREWPRLPRRMHNPQKTGKVASAVKTWIDVKLAIGPRTLREEGVTSPIDAAMKEAQKRRKGPKPGKIAAGTAKEHKALEVSTCGVGQSPLLHKAPQLDKEIGYDEA